MKVTKAKVTKNVETAAVGSVIPINLTLGNNFSKSDKFAVNPECCGPYHQCHCGSMHVPAQN